MDYNDNVIADLKYLRNDRDKAKSKGSESDRDCLAEELYYRMLER